MFIFVSTLYILPMYTLQPIIIGAKGHLLGRLASVIAKAQDHTWA